MSEKHDVLQRTQTVLGYRFTELTLLETALTHRSHSHEKGASPASTYERFEYLGDSLLGFLVAEWLFKHDPDAAEGTLSRRRQRVVRASTLAAVAQRLALGDAIRLGRGEELTGGRRKASLLSDLFEAVLGAVYLDGGIRPARAFVRRHLKEILHEVCQEDEGNDDYKTCLQEQMQAELRDTPRYRIVSTSGPAHALKFEVEVLAAGRVIGKGAGSNRKRAEQEAARQALRAARVKGD